MIASPQLKIVFLVSLLFTLAISIHNPGVVLQIPNNLQLPVIQLELPESVPSIVLQKLELFNIKVIQVQYGWRFSSESFLIELKKSLISFDWKYGHDSGYGSFIEQFSDLVVNWTISMDKDARFTVDIDNAKITNQNKKHSIKVHLGGGIPETLVIIITNQILNNAKFAFRSAIKSVVSKVILAFTAPIRQDVKLTCVQQKCIFLNTTLVAKPITSNNTVLIQVNAAPYIHGKSSGFLDPEDAIIKTSSNKINVHVHQLVLNRVGKLYIQLKPILQTINTTQISDIAEINSQTLSVIFPFMKEYANPRAVLLTVDVKSVQFSLNSSIQVKAKAQVKAETWSYDQSPHLFPYLSNATGNIFVKPEPIIIGSFVGMRINQIQLRDLTFLAQDIENKLVAPPKLIKHLPTLLKCAEQAINGGIGEKKEVLDFAGVEVAPKLTFSNNIASLEITFQSVTSQELVME